MKVAYISYLMLADVDFSYLEEAMKICDITCYIFVNQHHINKSVINIGPLVNKTGIFDWSIYPAFEKYAGMLDLNKIRFINLAEGKNWRWRGLKLFNLLIKELNQYDLVHLSYTPQGFDFPLYRIRNKCVLTVHDPLPHSGTSSLAELCRYISFKLIPRHILLNKDQRTEYCKHYGINPKRIIVSALSRYTCLNIVEPDLKSVPNKRYILFAGRISKYKGLQFLLPAFRKLHDHYPDINLVVAGGGNFEFDITEYSSLEYIELRNRFIPDSELVALIKGCEFMVCPYTDATQSGVIMSAFTFNKPVIATNVGGLPEMVEDNRFGLIVKEKDIDALVDGMTCMLDEPNMVKEFSSNIETDYTLGVRSWKSIAKGIIQFYNQK